eukprot:7793468-Pyramimonas_sp.AAC.1
MSKSLPRTRRPKLRDRVKLSVPRTRSFRPRAGPRSYTPSGGHVGCFCRPMTVHKTPKRPPRWFNMTPGRHSRRPRGPKTAQARSK